MAMTRILGIDPGSQRTGIGIIEIDAAVSTTSRWCCWARRISPSA